MTDPSSPAQREQVLAAVRGYCDDGRAVILYDPKDADKYIAAMKAERTKDGWRKACALASADRTGAA